MPDRQLIQGIALVILLVAFGMEDLMGLRFVWFGMALFIPSVMFASAAAHLALYASAKRSHASYGDAVLAAIIALCFGVAAFVVPILSA